MTTRTTDRLDHYYVYGDVYETLDACDNLELLLGRLRRQHLLSDQESDRTKRSIAEIRARLEAHLRDEP